MTDRDTLNKAKYRLSKALQTRDEQIKSYASADKFEDVCTRLGLPRLPREPVLDYINRCVEVLETGRSTPKFQGTPAAPRLPMKFQQLKPRPHLRQNEIDAQPVLVSMGGIGNGGNGGFGRGR
ncbi:hypothetical protein ACMHYJ_14145 [Castellaniella hirudinis]|uniref:hypothetical protein n=1 Tax=Castellaniella hirudinis TaxID=1144617 RepID=UPI0039C3B8D6